VVSCSPTSRHSVLRGSRVHVWSENGWAGRRHPQDLGKVGHQIHALFSLARRSCSSISSFIVGEHGWTGSAFLGVAFIQGRELQA